MTTSRWAVATIAICLAQTALPTVAETLSVNTTSSTPLATPASVNKNQVNPNMGFVSQPFAAKDFA